MRESHQGAARRRSQDGMVWRALLALVIAALLFACAAARDGSDLGARCTQDADCASQKCMSVGLAGKVCTRACLDDNYCPELSGWSCGFEPSAAVSVCTCQSKATTDVCGNGLDDDCSGEADEHCLVCDGVFVPSDDPNNCGDCGVVCTGQEICQAGRCQCPDEGDVACNGACVDLKADLRHCGACDNACGLGWACVDGECTCAGGLVCDGACVPEDEFHCGACNVACGSSQLCDNGQCICNVSGFTVCPDGCFDTNSDASHCGGCTPCAPTEVCVGGACTCPSGTSWCDAANACVALASDVNHCGSCGHTCPNGEVCEGGVCSCPNSNEIWCVDVGGCVDALSNPAHCGGCNACPTGQLCQNGVCGCLYGDMQWCASLQACSYLLFDNANCGTCDNACRPGEECNYGVCTCPNSGTWCASVNGCLDTNFDEQNCGGCGTQCNPGEICISGTCVCAEPADTWCASVNNCVDTDADPAHCGACDVACRPGEGCSFGLCACVEPDDTWCVSADTCVDTDNSAAHCGGCDTACRPGEICSSGTCACAAPMDTWCSSSNTCVDTDADAAHCGGCDQPCLPGQDCLGGSCVCLDSYQMWCSFAQDCTDVAFTDAHCGSCDNACHESMHCWFGNCICDAGLTKCGTTCFDLLSDEAHCGACNAPCALNKECFDGTCLCPAPLVFTEVRHTTDAIDDIEPAMAGDGARVGMAYAKGTMDTYRVYSVDLYFSLLNPDGTRALANDVPLVTGLKGRSAPDIVWTGTEYGVVWVESIATYDRQLMFQRFDANGAPIAGPLTIATGQDFYELTFPQIAWSAAAGEYAVITQPTYEGGIWFLRLAADGTPVAPRASVPTDTTQWLADLAASPSGWAITSRGYYNPLLTVLNPDGSNTAPTAVIEPSSSFVGSEVPLVYDGFTWSTAYVVNDGLSLNRGDQRNNPALLQANWQDGSTFYFVTGVGMTTDAAGALNIAWSLTSSGEYAGPVALQRFSLPSDGSSNVSPLTGVVEVLSSHSAIRSELTGQPIAVAPTASGALVAWADNRFGASEIYVRALDYGSCP